MKPTTRALSLTTLLFVALACQSTYKAQAQGRPISLPPQASEIAHGIYDLGPARDADGTAVQGFAFVHYTKEFARPEKPGASRPPKNNPCYALMGSGARWKAVENYVFDETEPGASDRVANLNVAISVWENAAGIDVDIIGAGSVGEVFPTEVGQMNNLNEVMFGFLPEPGVIAITYVWGVFNGPPQGRQLVEWDMVFDSGYGWWYEEELPSEPVGGTFDFLNIATHEIGHAMGLDHPSDTCTEETMYYQADFWEITKRDLHAGDIAGIKKLYP